MASSRRSIAVLAAVALLALRGPAARPAAADAPPRGLVRIVSDLLRAPCAEAGVPGMVGAIVTADGLEAVGATGVRRRGGSEAVTVDDRFHLGSCTKSMTATLIATFVEERRLAWGTTLAEAFPERAATMDAAWRPVTLTQLLAHRAGAPASLDADGLWGRLWTSDAAPRAQRTMLLDGVLARPPVHAPGTAFLYANAGFAIAGAVAEKVADTPWEDLMRTRLFEPLGMASAGFGAPGTKDAVDQPRGHRGGGPPVEPGRGADNPPSIGPAGTVHASIGDWGRYASLHLAGEAKGGLGLPAAAFRRLHEPAGRDPEYGFGWGVTSRDWGGRVLTHTGSNTMWFCVAWLAPEKGFGVLVACNQGGDEAAKACDRAAWALIQDHRAHAK